MIYKKVLLLGEKEANKTSFLLAVDNFIKSDKNLPSRLESNFLIKPIQINDTLVNLNIWSSLGMEQYNTFSPIYFKDASVAILIFALNNESSFTNIRKYLDLIKQYSKTIPFLFLVGNNNHLVDERVISYEQGQAFAEEINAYYYEISSKKGDGVEDLIKEVVIQSLNYGHFKLVINSIKCNYDFRALKNPFLYMTFTVNETTKQTQSIQNSINPEWNETIEFLINSDEAEKTVLKINMFNNTCKSPKSDIKLMKEISIPIYDCFKNKYDKDIFIKKGFFSKQEIGHLSINFDIIIPKNQPKKDQISVEKVTDETPSNIEFKIIDEQTIIRLLQKKKRIGSGATSIVYRVDDIFNGKAHLAVKILNSVFFQLMKPNASENIKFKKNFWEEEEEDDDDDIEEEEDEEEIPINEVQKILNEWELLSQLNHPNIIKTFGFYIGDKSYPPSIVLEYCKCNLEEAIAHLENIDLVKIVYQICVAMQYLHDNKIIHRDLKVKNILINSQKNVKICDFGIAKFIDVTNLSSITHNIGTFIYMAPELFNIESKIDEKIDVYAFGVVLYFIVTKGKIPVFDQNNPLENHKIPENVNEISQSIIKKCWSFLPEDRPSFKSIIETIVSNNFHLFDDINESISSLGL